MDIANTTFKATASRLRRVRPGAGPTRTPIARQHAERDAPRVQRNRARNPAKVHPRARPEHTAPRPQRLWQEHSPASPRLPRPPARLARGRRMPGPELTKADRRSLRRFSGTRHRGARPRRTGRSDAPATTRGRTLRRRASPTVARAGPLNPGETRQTPIEPRPPRRGRVHQHPRSRHSPRRRKGALTRRRADRRHPRGRQSA